jgi:membrane protein implicated in regulation of membrane protease activity
MFAKFFIFILFIAAEITLGIYSLAISESLLARFLFFILSAFIVCALVIKISNRLLPDDDRRGKKVMKKKAKKAQ